MWLKRQPPPHLPLPSQDRRISAKVVLAGNHSLHILKNCIDKRAAGNLLLLSLLNNPGNSINLKFSRKKMHWSDQTVRSRELVRRLALWIPAPAACWPTLGRLSASSLPASSIHALRMSWPTGLVWGYLRQSTLKARFRTATQNSNNSTSRPFQQAPVVGSSVNWNFTAVFRSPVQLWIPACF